MRLTESTTSAKSANRSGSRLGFNVALATGFAPPLAGGRGAAVVARITGKSGYRIGGFSSRLQRHGVRQVQVRRAIPDLWPWGHSGESRRFGRRAGPALFPRAEHHQGPQIQAGGATALLEGPPGGSHSSRIQHASAAYSTDSK